MTLRLILTRHAKSSWSHPGLGDHERPLNTRGRESAGAIGAWLRDKGYVPELVLSSDSARTRETWALVEVALGSGAEVEWLGALYHAGAQTMLDVLQGAGRTGCVMMLGHNPGIGGFAEMIVRRPPEHIRFLDYPTAATTVMDFDVAEWRSVDWGMGDVRDFVIPREL